MANREVAIVQARMGSQRLPGKVLEQLGHKVVLDWVIGRVLRVHSLDAVVVATTSDPEDDQIVDHLRQSNFASMVSVYRGSREDVLQRYVRAAFASRAETVLRVTADDPFKDPELIRDSLSEFKHLSLDYLATERGTGFPEGMDVEIISRQALDLSSNIATKGWQREHVTPIVRENPRQFHQKHLAPATPKFKHHRYTLDTRADLAFLSEVVIEIPAVHEAMSWTDLCVEVHSRPTLERAMPRVTPYAALHDRPKD